MTTTPYVKADSQSLPMGDAIRHLLVVWRHPVIFRLLPRFLWQKLYPSFVGATSKHWSNDDISTAISWLLFWLRGLREPLLLVIPPQGALYPVEPIRLDEYIWYQILIFWITTEACFSDFLEVSEEGIRFRGCVTDQQIEEITALLRREISCSEIMGDRPSKSPIES